MTTVVNNSAITSFKNVAIYVATNQWKNDYSTEATEALRRAVVEEVKIAISGGAKHVYVLSSINNKAEKEVVKTVSAEKEVHPVGVFHAGRKTTGELLSYVAWGHYEPKNENAWGVKHSSVVVTMGGEKNAFYAAKWAKEDGRRCVEITFEGGKPKTVIHEGKGVVGCIHRSDLEKVADHKSVTSKVAPVKAAPAPKKEVPAKAPAVNESPKKEEVKMNITDTIRNFKVQENRSPEYYDVVLERATASLEAMKSLIKEVKAAKRAAVKAAKAAEKEEAKKAKAAARKSATKASKASTKTKVTKKAAKVEVKEETPKVKEVIKAEKPVERPVQKEVARTSLSFDVPVEVEEEVVSGRSESANVGTFKSDPEKQSASMLLYKWVLEWSSKHDWNTPIVYSPARELFTIARIDDGEKMVAFNVYDDAKDAILGEVPLDVKFLHFGGDQKDVLFQYLKDTAGVELLAMEAEEKAKNSTPTGEAQFSDSSSTAANTISPDTSSEGDSSKEEDGEDGFYVEPSVDELIDMGFSYTHVGF